jgi:cytochrome c oxidase accessory protein FixG
MDDAASSKAKAIPINVDGLYEKHRTVYARSVDGIFNNWRWAMVVFTQALFYGLCWIEWSGRQAVLFHIVERKFYIFGLVFWPQDVIYLAVLLVISAYGLFLVTAVGGRLFCGYACPQTVYTEILMWIERKIEGERPARMKLDAQPMNPRKLRLKVIKHSLWLLIALWTGITFVGYFTPIRELFGEIAAFDLGPWEAFWIFFYSAFLYLMAGFLREQVCKYMCPYARFQGVMFDPDTLIISYDPERGEPRGLRRKGAAAKAQPLGDCVDCSICVQVCPTGIDIRNGLQLECIACAACIDACDQVMDKVGSPRGLIRYSTENALAKHYTAREMLAHLCCAQNTAVFQHPAGDHHGGGVESCSPRALEGRCAARPLDLVARGGRRTHRERLPAAHLEHRRSAASLFDQVSGIDGIDIVGERLVEVPRPHRRPSRYRRGSSRGRKKGSKPDLFRCQGREPR